MKNNFFIIPIIFIFLILFCSSLLVFKEQLPSVYSSMKDFSVSLKSITGFAPLENVIINFKDREAIDYSNKNSAVNFKDNCKTKCINGICNVVIGNTKYVNDSDGQCKPIEEARSLMNSDIKLIIEKDNENDPDIIIEDYNLTSVILSEIDSEEEVQVKIYENILGSLRETDKKRKLIKSEDFSKQQIFEIGLDKELHFGNNSTTITLQDANTENLEDGMFDEDNTVDGSQAFMYIDLLDGTGEIGFIKFNISAIPENAIIVSADLGMYDTQSSAKSKLPAEIFYSDNLTWVEEEIDALCGDGVVCSDLDRFFTTYIGGFYRPMGQADIDWVIVNNLESYIQTEVDRNGGSVSFVINQTEGNTAFYYSLNTKEAVSNKPYLNITYVTNASVQSVNPTTGSPLSVSEGENISIYFSYLVDGVNQTHSIFVNNITIGGIEVNITSYVESSGNIYFDDFESDWGNWINAYSNGNPFNNTDNWTRDSEGTPSGTTGPCNGGSGTGCGAEGSDYYLFVETSTGYCYDQNDSAGIFESPPINFDEHYTEKISFWLNMYGDSIGTITLDENTTGEWKKLWEDYYDHGTDWFQSEVDLSTLSGNGTLRFNYLCGLDYYGDIAIDRINISYGGTVNQRWLDGSGWLVNVTAPSGLSGLQDLVINASYLNKSRNTTETEAINYAGADTTPPDVTIVSPTATTYTSSAISFEARTNENSLCNYSLDTGATNTSLTANSTGTGHTASQTLSNSNYVANFYCSDLLGNQNNSENVSFTVSVSSTTPSGGGGGGGGITTSRKPEFTTSYDSYEKTISLNSIEFEELTITNTGKYEKEYTISVETIGDIILFEETKLTLQPGNSETIDFKVLSPEEAGVYAGKVIVDDGVQEKEILFSINIKTEKNLFDISLVIPNFMKSIGTGDVLNSQINLVEMGLKENIDVTLHYIIKDYSGRIYLDESETFAVYDQKSLTKEFSTENLAIGDYVLGIELIYPDGVAVASSQFKVQEKVLGFSVNKWIVAVISFAIIFIFGTIIITIKRYKLLTKRLKKRKV